MKKFGQILFLKRPVKCISPLKILIRKEHKLPILGMKRGRFSTVSTDVKIIRYKQPIKQI